MSAPSPILLTSMLLNTTQMSLTEAVESPRLHWENHVFNVEPPLLRDNIEQLNLPELSKVILWQEINMFFGGVHAVRKTATGFEGAGDPRREGIAMIDDE